MIDLLLLIPKHLMGAACLKLSVNPNHASDFAQIVRHEILHRPLLVRLCVSFPCS
jgi:hypothetical protein